ncbi:protein NUCLEAR FUSION DEFECTIVE 4-like [Ananas comosus]|uniref:Protein NUCLEAR FUSION DEFECTIVE 4-like n=1 Tax=Ananas comosus TaxID=4615 RepID=A0A6P5G786_ANACO|nr:protein NUCLEAR FUSION DEFECTIVE 4-like [Ananas comosus]
MPSSSLHWLSLVATIWLQTINGPNSDFAVYSSQLKDIKHFSQVQLNMLAFASDAGKLFGWFSGIAAIYLPLWLVSVIGAAFGLVGYGVQFLFLENPKLSYWHLFLLTSLAGNGICWINTVCYLLCIRNFPYDRRAAVGISTSYVGLSAKVYTVVVDAIFRPKDNSTAKSYLLLNAIFPLLVTLPVSPFLRVFDAETRVRLSTGFLALFVITIATGVCAIVGSIGSASTGLSSRHLMLSLAILLLSPVILPLVVKLRERAITVWKDKKENRIHDLTLDEVEAGEGSAAEVEMKEEETNEVGTEEGREEVGGLKMLRKVDFWLYFFGYMFSATLGLVFLNNLGQIAESRGLTDASSTLVSLSSSFGFFGRLVPSFLDYYLSKAGYAASRSASMAALMAPMSGAFFMLLAPRPSFLYVGTAVIGACTGAITTIAVSATTELFGTKHFGVNHNIVVANIPVGSLIFGYFAAFVYEKGADGDYSCFGTHCYSKTFVAWGSTCSLATLLCTILYFRSRKFSVRTT